MAHSGPLTPLETALAQRRAQVYQYLRTSPSAERLRLAHLREAIVGYLRHPGKSLRATLLLFSCGAVGGEEARALPAAAAVEVYHLWTLIHDDIIDQDTTRRGIPTVHTAFTRRAIEEFGLQEEMAAHYGLTIGLLAGDVLQGWSAALLAETAMRQGANPTLVLELIRYLFSQVETDLVEGEALDVQFSHLPVEQVSDEAILDMLWKKTSALYGFAATAGGCIGLDAWQPEHPLVQALAGFAGAAGLAFQLQDDILGVIGDQQVLGKPVGSDIREGKRTVVVSAALRQASPHQRTQLLRILGNRVATPDEIQGAIHLLQELGGVAHAQSLAANYLTQAHRQLAALPPSPYRDLLGEWTNFLVQRRV